MPSGSRPAPRHPAGERGFACLLLLVTVAVLGLAASAVLELGATATRRETERELLAVGADLERALRSYAGPPVAGPVPGQRPAAAAGARGPRELQDLLKDPRSAGLRRHLRQLPADPLTGRVEWGVVRDEAGFIRGVFSLAPGRPIRQAGFGPEQATFTQADSYAGWVFGLSGSAPAAPDAARRPQH